MVITIYDLSGIQPYIFATNKLREQIGGSKIVFKLLNDEFDKALSKLSNAGLAADFAYEEEKLFFIEGDKTDDEIITDGKSYRIVYIGGGNAVVLYRNQACSDFVTRELQKRTLILTGGEIKLCHAGIEIKPEENKKYAELYAELMKKLIKFKANSAPIRTASGFAINADDPISHEAITRVGSNDGALSLIQKNKYCKKSLNSQKNKFLTDFEQLRDDDRKSYVAVVHIDGDSMGKNIEKFVSNLGDNEKGDYYHKLNESMKNVAEMSAEIDNIYKNVMRKTIDHIFEGFDEKDVIPFRPIVEDGDDITFIIAAEKAFEFTEKFASLLKAEIAISDERSQNTLYPILLDNEFSVSVSAGIAFVHDKYPFSQAYELAEELCRKAKKFKRALNISVSSMDFHVVSGSERIRLTEFREKNYTFGKAVLHKRPYFYDDLLSDDDKEIIATQKRNYSEFKNLLSTYSTKKNDDEDMSSLSRSKYKALRDAYSEGIDAAESQFKTMLLRNPLRVDSFNEAFEMRTVDGEEKKVATLFDFVDAFDMGGY